MRLLVSALFCALASPAMAASLQPVCRTLDCGRSEAILPVCQTADCGRGALIEAHHSFSMFDQQKTTTLNGVVEEFTWANPHCFIKVLVNGERWLIEMSAPRVLQRDYGLTADSFKPDTQIRLVVHPLYDESAHGGHFVRAVLPDGREIGERDPGGTEPGEWPPKADTRYR